MTTAVPTLPRTRPGQARVRGRTPQAPTPAVGHPLVVTNNTNLIDELVRIAAAAGREITVARDPVDAQTHWRGSASVIVGADMAAACARARPPRHSRLLLVSLTPDKTELDRIFPFSEVLGADRVAVLPAAEPWLATWLQTATTTDSPRPVIGVIGGRGGVGATVLASALVVTAARQGARALLVDADPNGGGIDVIFGWESLEGSRWPELEHTKGRLITPSLSVAGDLAVVTWDQRTGDDLNPAVIDATLAAGRDHSDVTIVDLPRVLDEAGMRALQNTDRVYLLVPQEVRGCAAAAALARRIGPHGGELHLVVRGPAHTGLRPRDISRVLDLPLAGVLRHETGLTAALERGQPPAGRGRGPLAALSRRILADLHIAGERRDGNRT